MSDECKTCKYWRFIRNDDFIVSNGMVWKGPHGECMRIEEYSDIAWLASTTSDDCEPTLITSPNFGCVLHEFKNN